MGQYGITIIFIGTLNESIVGLPPSCFSFTYGTEQYQEAEAADLLISRSARTLPHLVLLIELTSFRHGRECAFIDVVGVCSRLKRARSVPNFLYGTYSYYNRTRAGNSEWESCQL